MPDILTLADAAEYLRISIPAARMRVARGQMPGVFRENGRVRVWRARLEEHVKKLAMQSNSTESKGQRR